MEGFSYICNMENVICKNCNSKTDETFQCERCDKEMCEHCQTPFNQFTQIDYNCCTECAELND